MAPPLFTSQKTQNFGCLSNCRYCADRAQNLPVPAPNIWLTIFQISSKLVHFRRSYSWTREGRSFGHRVFLQYSHELRKYEKHEPLTPVTKRPCPC